MRFLIWHRIRFRECENLELLSWTSIPKSITVSGAKSITFISNAVSSKGSISNHEVDLFSFTAPSHGTFTFDIGQNSSKIDTVAGLFTGGGSLIKGDNDSGPSSDSEFTASLSKGPKCIPAVTNHTGKPGGKW